MKTLFLCAFLGLSLFASDVDFDSHLEITPEEYAQRRNALREKLDAPAVFMGNILRNRINDTNYEFRQESDFLYLTGYTDPGAFLIISPTPFEVKGKIVKECLFVPENHSKRAVIYEGALMGSEHAMKVLGIELAVPVSAREGWRTKSLFDPYMKEFADKNAKFYLNTPIINYHEFGKDRTSYYDAYKDNMLAQLNPPNPEGNNAEAPVEVLERRKLRNWMRELRSVKSAKEIAMLQRAVDITLSGHEESLKIAKDVPYEYQVEAAIEYAFRYNGAEAVGYNSIVGCGPNGTILHYSKNSDAIKHQQMFVLDAGAEYRNYTADITRSFPADGTFSKEQKEIYNLVLAAQKAGAKEFVPGSNYMRVNAAIEKVLKKGLKDLGLIGEAPVVELTPKELRQRNPRAFSFAEDITVDGEVIFKKGDKPWGPNASKLNMETAYKWLDESQYYQLCPHGWGHSVGLDVHDANGETYAPGMVYTIEPGIYISAERLDFEIDPKYDNIGVRIEDMWVITEDGNHHMSSALPRDIDALETFMAQKSHLLLKRHNHKH